MDGRWFSARRIATPALCIAALLFLIAPGTRAATILIRPDGSGDFPTIQAGIDAAAGGDVVLLADGTFTGPGNRDLDYLGKAITVRSQSGDAAACVIDAQTAGRGFYFHNGEGLDSRLERVTITNGSADDGGGVYCYISCSPAITGCRFVANTVTQRGAGLLCRGSAATVTDCVFEWNNAGEGQGGGIWSYGSTLSVSGCTFASNMAHQGGGMLCVSISGPISGCLFDHNLTYGSGGGLYLTQGCAGPIDHCTFTGNMSGPGGGGLQLEINCSPEITACEFRDNSGENGGALSCYNACAPVLSGCLFAGNDGHWGGALAVDLDCNATLSDCRFTRNEALNRAGAIFARESTVTLNHCLLDGNVGGAYGGAISLFRSTFVAGWCTFYDNRSSYAGGLFDHDASTVTMQRTIIAFSGQGPAIYCSYGGVADLTCCDIYGNPDGDWTGCLEGQDGTRGNFSADPRFCDPLNGDFTLAADSPCAAENSPFGCGPIGGQPVGCDAPVSTLAEAERAPGLGVTVTPNPARGSMRLAFDVPPHAAGSPLRLRIFDPGGRVVRDLASGPAVSGRHEVPWDGFDNRGCQVPAGVYAWRLEVGSDEREGRLVIVP
jgi:hypothetical protein